MQAKRNTSNRHDISRHNYNNSEIGKADFALVTGATGFIGSFLTRALVKQGRPVRALALPGEKTDWLDDLGVEVRYGDLTDPGSIKGIAEGVDLVFHLAARVTDWGRREQFYAAIYDATRNLLDECGGKARRFVYASSVCACGLGRHLRGHTEEDPVFLCGIPYADAKLDTERLVLDHHARGGLAATIVRPTNVIGPGSVYVRDVVERYRGSIVFSIDHGRHSASLVYVENLVDGMILAGTSEVAAGRIYHLRDDWSVTWGRYLADLGGLIGKRPAFSVPYCIAWHVAPLVERVCTSFGWRPPATRHTLSIMGRDLDLDTTRAREELGWKSRISYEEAMKRIGAWVAAEMPG